MESDNLAAPRPGQRLFFDTGPDGETLVYRVERLWLLARHLPIETIALSELDDEGGLSPDPW